MNNLSIKVAEQTLKLLAINEWENISVNKVFKKLNINKKKLLSKLIIKLIYLKILIPILILELVKI